MAAIDELASILFIDIETVSGHRSFDELSSNLQELWEGKHGKKKKKVKGKKAKSDEESASTQGTEDSGSYSDKAGLIPEFGRIVCISMGRFIDGTGDENLNIQSIYSDDEVELLTKFSEVLNRKRDYKLCAHNGKGFDFPYLAKRMLMNRLPLPPQLDLFGKKPWEIPHLDTNEMWSFGSRSFNDGAQLKYLCGIFGFPSPKDDIDGSEVGSVYYNDNDLPRIVKYCEKDIVALAKVYKRLRGIA